MKYLLLAALCLAPVFRVSATTPIDREQVYRASLPRYADNSRAPLSVHISERRSFPDCHLLRFSYAGANGNRVPALLFLPDKASSRHQSPCLIVLHGLGGTKEEMSGFCRFLAQSGYATCAIDLYGHGERTLPRRQSTTASQLEADLQTAVTRTAIDVRRALDYASTRPEINKRRLGLAGFSLGAIIGTIDAGIDTRIKATVLVSGGGGWGEILRVLSVRYADYQGQTISGLANQNWDSVNASLAAEDPITFAPHIAPRALLMINGTADTTILPSRARALYDAARSAPNAHAQIVWLAGAGHLPSVDTVFPRIRQWLSTHL